MGTYDRRAWWKRGEDGVVRVRQPNLSLKLSVIVTREGVLTFQISHTRHLQKDVEDFLSASLQYIRKRRTNKDPPYLVLDNSPKNRGKGLINLAEKGLVTPIFITPGCPQHNLAEYFFNIAKKNFSDYRNLAYINGSESGVQAAVEALLSSLAKIQEKDHEKMLANYFWDAKLLTHKENQSFNTL